MFPNRETKYTTQNGKPIHICTSSSPGIPSRIKKLGWNRVSLEEIMLLSHLYSCTYHRSDVSLTERHKLFLSTVIEFLQNYTKMCWSFSNHPTHGDITAWFFWKLKYIQLLFDFKQAIRFITLIFICFYNIIKLSLRTNRISCKRLDIDIQITCWYPS